MMRRGSLRLGIGLDSRLLAATLLFSLAAAPSGGATYAYQGQSFSFIVGPSYTTAMRVTGSFDVTLPLPPNLGLTAFTPDDFTFFDGVKTRTKADSVICRFEVGTDSTGAIAQWFIYVMENGVAVGNPRHTIATTRQILANDVGGTIASASSVAADCLGVGLADAGSNDSTPGSWMRTDAPVPTLPVWGLLLLVAILGLVAVRKVRRVARPLAG